jgi:hypothetical protein
MAGYAEGNENTAPQGAKGNKPKPLAVNV